MLKGGLDFEESALPSEVQMLALGFPEFLLPSATDPHPLIASGFI